MKSIEIQTDNKEIIEAFKKLAEAFNVKFTEKEDLTKAPNPSPSNYPYFENPGVLKGIKRGIEDSKAGRVVKLTREEREKLLGL
jgi:hypothetical protein